MRCLKCHNEIQPETSFCPNCGTPVERQETVKKIVLKCENCGGTLTVDSGKSVLFCPFCGQKTLIMDNDEVTIEKIRASTQKEIALEKIKSKDRHYKMEEEKERRNEEKNQVDSFKKSKFSKLLIIAILVAALFTYLSFSQGRILAGILSSVQVICFALAWCMGMKIIKEKKRYIHVLVAVAGVILVIPTLKSCGSAGRGALVKEIDWGIIFLGDAIPEPPSKKLDIHYNTEKELWIDVLDITEEDYYTYLVACKEAGYTIEPDESSIGYSAYNEEGYHLDLGYHGSDEMTIQLDPPTKMTTLDWKAHSIALYLPEPDSNQGAFQNESEKSIAVVVGGISKEAFSNYSSSCIEKGFKIDSKSSKDYYTAYDQNGNNLSISYNSGNKEMKIIFKFPMEFKEITWPTVGVGTLLPLPDSLSGNIGSNYDWAYSVYIEDTTREEYEQYTQKCIEAGFDKDIRNYEDSVWADYSDDISMHVSYEGYNIMYINVSGSVVKDYSSYKSK